MMVPLFVLIMLAAVIWHQRHRPTAKRLFTVTIHKRRERPKPARPVKRR